MLTWLHHNFCRFWQLHIHAANLPFSNIPKVFRSGDWEGHQRNIELVMFMKPVWDDFCFVTWCIIMLEVAIRKMGTLWPWWYAHGQQQYSNRLWHSSNDWLVLTGPKCAKKTFPTPLHHRHQPGLLTQGGLGPWIHAVGDNSDPTICMPQQKSRFIRPGTFFQSSTVQFWWACAHCSLSFLFLADRSGTWRGLQLLSPQGSVSLKQAGHSPLPSLIKKVSVGRSASFWCFSHHFEESVVVETPRRSAVTEIRKPVRVAPTIMPAVEITHFIKFFPILMVDVNINWSLWPVSVWSYALHC